MNGDLMHDLRSAHKTQWAILIETKGLVIALSFDNYISGDGARGELSLCRRAQIFWVFYASLKPEVHLP